jgi:hypothetical protein
LRRLARSASLRAALSLASNSFRSPVLHPFAYVSNYRQPHAGKKNERRCTTPDEPARPSN